MDLSTNREWQLYGRNSWWSKDWKWAASCLPLVIWKLPKPLPDSSHAFKYRMAYIANQRCVLRFDNEAGKGDHKHMDEIEVPYMFSNLDTLQKDFWAEVN